MATVFVTVGLFGWALFWVGVFTGIYRVVTAEPAPAGETRKWILKERPWYARVGVWMGVGAVVGMCVFYPLIAAAS